MKYSAATSDSKSHRYLEVCFISLAQKPRFQNFESRRISESIAWLFFVLVLSNLMLCSSVAYAQETAPQEQPINTSRDKSHSIRGSIYKKTLKDIEVDGYGSQFKLRLSLAVYEPKFVKNLFNLKFQSYGLRPQLNVKIPTPIKHTSFVPSLEAAATYESEQSDWFYSGSIFLGLDYNDERGDSNLGGTVGLKYGTRYDDDAFNPSDYLEFKVVGRFRQNLKWKIKEHTTTLNPFVQASYFLDNLEYGTDELVTGDRRRRYEVGIRLSTLPRMRVLGIRVPEIRASYFFGDGVKGFKFRI